MTTSTHSKIICTLQKKHQPFLHHVSRLLVVAMIFQTIPIAMAKSAIKGGAGSHPLVNGKCAFARTAKSGSFSTKAVKEAGEHGGRLTPTTEDVSEFSDTGNEAFGACMQLWNQHRWEDAKNAMLRFSNEYPDDPWVGEADLHVACFHRFQGSYQAAEEILVKLYEKNKDNPIGRKSLVRLGRLYYDTYRYQAAYEVFWTLLQMDPIENEKTFALNWLYHIPRAWMSAAEGRECGPKAFGYAAWLLDNSDMVKKHRSLEQHRRGKSQPDMEHRAYLPPLSFAQMAKQYPWAQSKGGSGGVSLTDMRQVLSGEGITMETREVSYDELVQCVSEDKVVVLCLPAPDQPAFIAPSGIADMAEEKAKTQLQLKGSDVAADLGHYMVLVKATDRNAWLIDPENGLLQKDAIAIRDLWLRGQERGLAVFLGREGQTSIARGKRLGIPVGNAVEDAFFGGCCGHEIDNEDTGCPEDGDAKGMPEHSVNVLNLNYLVTDTPIWIDSPRGADLNLTLTYNNRQASSAKYPIEDVQFYPFGFRWSAPYDGNYALDPATNILVHFPNGMEVYFDRLVGGSYEPRNSRYTDHFKLTEYPDDSIRVDLKDGLKKYYFHPHTLLDEQQTLYRIEDQFGQGIDIIRDGGGRITTVESDVTGSSLNYLYDLNGNVTNVYERDGSDNATGRNAAFTYEVSGSNAELKTMTDMGGYTTTFDYGVQTYQAFGSSLNVTTDHHIVSYTWPNQGQWGFDLEQTLYQDYDEPLRLTVTDPESNTTVYNAYAYNDYGPTGKKDRNGSTVMWGLDRAGGNVVGRYGSMVNERFYTTYDRQGEYRDFQDYDSTSGKREILFERTYAEEATGYLDDKEGFRDYPTDVERKDVDYHYQTHSNGTRTITMTNKIYEVVNGSIANTDTWTEYILQDEYFDPIQIVNRVGDITYLDRTNRLVKAVRILPFGGTEKTIYEATYTGYGQLETATMDEGLVNKVEYTYGSQGQLNRVDYPDGTHEGFWYDSATFFLLEYTNRMDQVTTVVPDDMGRTKEVYHPDGTDSIFSYGCCAADSFKDRHGITSNYDYDANKRLDWAIMPMDDETDTHIEYDYLGEGELKTLGYGAYGDDLATRSFEYLVTNGWTRLKARVTPEGKTPQSWTYTFTGLPETMTDGRGVVTEYVWNEAKSQLKQKIVHGASNGLEQVTVDYIYDGLDRLSNVVKNVTGLGNIWSETYGYDDRSRVETVDTTVANIPGQTGDLEYTVEYAYGNRGFVTNRTVSVGGAQASATAYTYEPDSARMVQVADDFASAEYGFDQYGRLEAQTNAIVGAVSSQTVKTWSYDEFSKVDSLTISNSTALLWVNEFGYDVERINAITNLHNNTRWSYGYDYQGQLKGADLFSSSNALAHVERYKFDAVGNITHKGIAGGEADIRLINNADDETVQYEHHKTATMIGTVGDTNAVLSLPISQIEVVQDNHGNWIVPLVPLYPMSNGNVRIQLKAEVVGQNDTYKLADFTVNPTTTNLSYDANGALLTLPNGTSTAASLEWNSEGRLASTTSNSSTNSFYYDDHGRRIAKVEGGTLALYLWDGMDNFGVGDSAGNITEYYTRGIGIAGDVGTLVAAHDFGTSTTTLLHSNHRGDVVLATDNAGVVVHETEYLPFGNILASTGSYAPRFGFSSKETDLSGLVYYGYRYYSPQLNQWLSPDPLGEGGSINLYRFCGNSPINNVDIDGRIWWVIAIKVVALITTAVTGLLTANKITKNITSALEKREILNDLMDMMNELDADPCDVAYADNFDKILKLKELHNEILTKGLLPELERAAKTTMKEFGVGAVGGNIIGGGISDAL